MLCCILGCVLNPHLNKAEATSHCDHVLILGKSRAFSLVLLELSNFLEFGAHQPFEGTGLNFSLTLWLSMPNLFLANEQGCCDAHFCADVRACFVDVIRFCPLLLDLY